MTRSTRLLRRLRRLALAVVLFCLLIVAPDGPRPAFAQGELALDVTTAFEGNYAPERWLPLSIVLRNGGPPTSVVVAATLPNVLTRSSAAVALPGAGETALTLYVAMDSQAREVRVSVERDGATLAEQRVEVRPRPGERLTAVVSTRPLELGLPRREDLQTLPLMSFPLSPGQLYDQPAGLASLTAIVLGDLPAETLRPAQQAALHAWVRDGGHLVIGGGVGATATLTNLPPELRPAQVGAPIALDPATLATYATPTTGAEGSAAAPSQLEGVTLTPEPDAAILGTTAAPLWAQRDLGHGRITQLAFDPGLPTLTAWAGAPAFWNQLLRPARPLGLNGDEPNIAALQGQTLASALGNLPAINLPATGPLFALLVVYTVLIGPGAALLLRRLDRQALGWFVLPAVALGFLAITTGLAIASRADQRIVSQVTLVEQIDGTTARARAAVGILTPRNETFAVMVGADAAVRPLASSSARFGVIASAAGDLAQGGEPLQLQVASWELQGVQAEALVPIQALDAEFRLSEQAIETRVRNTTGRQLRDVVVVYAGTVVSLGDLAPEQERTATWPPSPPTGTPRPELGVPLSALVLGEAIETARQEAGAPDRRTLIQAALLNAAVGRGMSGENPEPVVLAWLDETPLPLDVEAPGAARQQIGLLVSRPRFSGSGPAFVPAGWMQLEPDRPQRSTCTGVQGRGLVASPAPLTIKLVLPAGLATFQAASATIELDSERSWPNAGVRTELYNWQTERWVEVPFDGPDNLVLGDAAPFVRGGRLLLRFDGRIDEAGCVFANGILRGSMP